MFNYLFKIIVLGDTNTGKTSILNKITNNKYKYNNPTIGIDFTSFITKIDDSVIKCQVWDTAGQEKFAPVISSYYKNISAAVIVYDVTDIHTFKKVQYWYDNIKSHLIEDKLNIGFILVANKTDINNKRVIDNETGLKLANKLNMLYHETNIYDNSTTDMFTKLFNDIYTNKDKYNNKGIKTLDDILNINDYNESKRECCIIS